MSSHAPLSPEEVSAYLREVKPLTTALDLISDHVVITDVDGNIVYANPAVSTHTGYPLDEILGKNPGDLWGGKMSEEFFGICGVS